MSAPTVPNQAAEACTEVGADPVMPREAFYALEGPFARYPRLGIALLAAVITVLLCLAPEDPYTDDQHEAVADQLAASEVQP